MANPGTIGFVRVNASWVPAIRPMRQYESRDNLIDEGRPVLIGLSK